MSRSVISCIRYSALLVLPLIGPLAAEASGPAIALSGSAGSTFETTQESVTLTGSARTSSPVASVRWVNQLGLRGAGTWTDHGQGTATWTVPQVALRLGANLITVTVVDAANGAASVHLAVNRKPSLDQPSRPGLKIGAGTLQNRPIVFQIRNGQAVVEGDIIVALSTFSRLDAAAVPATAPGPAAAARGAQPGGIAIDYRAQFWPKVGSVYQVPYTVTGTSTTSFTNAITDFNKVFKGLIQFVPWSSETDYVNITVQAGGSGEGYSNVGMVGGGQSLYCGSGCTEATWLHEMGHAVGLLHEHQRPDRLNYITLYLANADLPNVPGNFTLFSYDYQTLGLYDYASVMHYCAFCFSKAGLPVLESVPAGIPLSNDAGYSAGDIDQIERLYGKAPSAVTVTTNPTGLQIIVDGVTYTAPQTFSFALNSEHTLAVPADPQYTSPADGSTYAFGNWNDLGTSAHTIFIEPGAGTLASPAKKPLITMYEANFVRLQPFAFLSPAAYPSGSGTVAVSPAPLAEFGGSFYTDRTLVRLTYTANAGYDFYGWYNLPYPQSDNPHAFYIEAPTTSAQAVFLAAAMPVTIVGETITGPNTWNPLLAGYVDGAFTPLPAGFSSGNNYNPTWGAGTTHSVSVDQTQSPVTTNVYYDWISWNDSGAITHSVTQAATGGQTISASFTPYYASYTVPPPLTSTYPSCAGGVTTFPAGVVYPLNTAFGFYADGTSVMSTATPNPAFPAMLFAGWAGSLGGATNPQTVTIHDQFVPTANFNLSTTPLAITSLTPSSAVASATKVLNVAVKGTGFTTTGYANWNGSSRSITPVSPTQLTLHLLAGDLTTPGGQDIWVGNLTTNTSNVTCGGGVETSFTVAAAARGKGATTVTVTPATLSFAATKVGATSAAQTVALKNTGTAALAIGAIGPQGLGATSFTVPTNSCGSTLAAAASCTFTVAFSPAAIGALTGTLAVTDDATGSPQTMALKGTGKAP